MPAFDELRTALQADGADLALERVSDGVATVRLILGAESCLECIMPKQTLEGILLASLAQSGAGVQRVELLDPRIPA